MTDNVINTDTRGVLIPAIPNRGRGHAIFGNFLFDEIINCGCGLPRLDNLDHVIQNFGRNCPALRIPSKSEGIDINTVFGFADAVKFCHVRVRSVDVLCLPSDPLNETQLLGPRLFCWG